jgi:NTE family protein
VLSSGFFGFFAHTGFALALERAGVSPMGYAGSSAGALVAAVRASGTSATELAQELGTITREDFWDPAPGLGLLRGERFRQRVYDMLEEKTFERCPTPLAVSVFRLSSRRTEVLRRGDISTAVRASCSFPFLLQPAQVEGAWYIDGGVLDRPGVEGVPSSACVLFHHLESRSPWRRPTAASARIPTRDRMLSVTLRGLPRSGPLRLPEGKQAMHLAYERTARWLAEAAPESASFEHPTIFA